MVATGPKFRLCSVVVAQGETLKEAIAMTRDAIEAYIASLKKHGDPIPSEQNIVMTVTVAA